MRDIAVLRFVFLFCFIFALSPLFPPNRVFVLFPFPLSRRPFSRTTCIPLRTLLSLSSRCIIGLRDQHLFVPFKPSSFDSFPYAEVPSLPSPLFFFCFVVSPPQLPAVIARFHHRALHIFHEQFRPHSRPTTAASCYFPSLYMPYPCAPLCCVLCLPLLPCSSTFHPFCDGLSMDFHWAGRVGNAQR